MSRLIRKDITQILIESSATETFNVDNIADASIKKSLLEEVNYLEEMQTDIEYHEEMIPLVVQETSFGNRFVVEYDMLHKLMESQSIDAKEALERLCEHNEINIADTYVAIESCEYIIENLKQFDKVKDIKSKTDIKAAVKTIEDLKDKGIKLLTKKSKNSKNKKKK